MKIEWLPIAIESLLDQLAFIGRRNAPAAARCGDRVEQATARLMDHPLIGRQGRKAGTRELVVSRTPFVIVYRLERDAVTILRVLHGAQDWPATP